MKTMYYSNKKYIALFVLPAFLIFVTVMFLPILQSVNISFYRWNGLGKKAFIGFENYKLLFQDETFLLSMINTTVLVTLSLILSISFGLFVAYILSKGIKGSNLFRTAFFIPAVISSVVIGLLWGFIYKVDFGLINSLLKIVGLDVLTRDWLGDRATVMVAISIAIIWQYLGYYIMLLLAGMNGISEEIFEAAKIDGASQTNIFFSIVIPLVKPIIRICVVFIVTGGLKCFDEVFVMSGGGPAHASEVISTIIYREAFLNLKFGYASSISTVLLVLSFGITGIINKKSKNSEV